MKRTLSLLLLLSAACDDFESPATLDRPQLAAMQAEPPLVAAGNSAALRALFLGPEGELVPDSVAWEPVAATEGGMAVGTIETDPMGVVRIVPPPGLTEPTPAAVQITAVVGDKTIRGIKALVFSAPAEENNPVVDSVTVDGVPAGMDPVTLPAPGSK